MAGKDDNENTNEKDGNKSDKIDEENNNKNSDLENNNKNSDLENDNKNGNEENTDKNGNEENTDKNGNEETTTNTTTTSTIPATNTSTIPRFSYTEYYLNGYCTYDNGKSQKYARDEFGNEIYWRDSSYDKIYAYKTDLVNGEEHQIELPAENFEGEPNYIFDRGIPRYPENLTTRDVILPIDKNTGEEFYIPDARKRIRYPENSYGRQFYRKDVRGNQVPLDDYIKLSDGTQIYPEYANKDQFYLKDNLLNDKPAKMKIGNKFVEYYAKLSNGNQIYPSKKINQIS